MLFYCKILPNLLLQMKTMNYHIIYSEKQSYFIYFLLLAMIIKVFCVAISVI